MWWSLVGQKVHLKEDWSSIFTADSVTSEDSKNILILTDMLNIALNAREQLLLRVFLEFSEVLESAIRKYDFSPTLIWSCFIQIVNKCSHFYSTECQNSKTKIVLLLWSLYNIILELEFKYHSYI